MAARYWIMTSGQDLLLNFFARFFHSLNPGARSAFSAKIISERFHLKLINSVLKFGNHIQCLEGIAVGVLVQRVCSVAGRAQPRADRVRVGGMVR